MDGKTLALLLLGKGYRVVGTYRRTTININELHNQVFDCSENIFFEYCDITDEKSVEKLFLDENYSFEEIYLLAAQSHVGDSFNSPVSTFITNSLPIHYVCNCVKKYQPNSKIYLALTSELFGGQHENPCNEKDIFQCRSPYSIGKEAAWRWAEYYRQQGVFVSCGILFNHSNVFRGDSFFISKVTKGAAEIALGSRKNIVLGPYLDFTRDEHWSDFGCDAMWNMLQQPNPDDFVIANGKDHRGTEYLEIAFDYFNLGDWKKYVVQDQKFSRPNEVQRLVGDSSKAQKILNWVPNRIPFEDHISLMCQYHYLKLKSENVKIPNVFDLYPV